MCISINTDQFLQLREHLTCRVLIGCYESVMIFVSFLFFFLECVYVFFNFHLFLSFQIFATLFHYFLMIFFLYAFDFRFLFCINPGKCRTEERKINHKTYFLCFYFIFNFQYVFKTNSKSFLKCMKQYFLLYVFQRIQSLFKKITKQVSYFF